MSTHEEKIKQISDMLDSINEQECEYFKKNAPKLPGRADVVDIIAAARHIMFPKYTVHKGLNGLETEACLEYVYSKLKRQIALAFAAEGVECDSAAVAYELLGELPNIKELLIKDAQAIYEGDPAARGTEEVMLSYPGFTAISVFRLAHELYKRNIPYLPRMMYHRD